MTFKAIPLSKDQPPPISFPFKPKRGRPTGSKTKRRNPNKPASGKHDSEYWYYLGSEISRLSEIEKAKPSKLQKPIYRIISDFIHRERGKPTNHSITEHAVREAYYEYRKIWKTWRALSIHNQFDKD